MRTRPKKTQRFYLVYLFSLSVSIPLTLGQYEKKNCFKNRFLNLIINPFDVILRQSSVWLNVGENMRSGNVARMGYMRNTSAKEQMERH